MILTKNDEKLDILFRIGICFTFMGHGYYAFTGKSEWIPLVQAYGFSYEQAIIILPLIGVMDMLVGASILIKPLKPIIIWAAIWAFIAALSRPLSGMDLLEMIERSSNWALPLAYLLYSLKNQKLIKEELL